MPEIVIFIGFFVFVFVVVIVGSVLAQQKSRRDAEETARRFAQAQQAKRALAEKREREKNANKKTGFGTQFSKMESTLVHSHGHTGDTIETYDPNFGSIGEVTDEGCPELLGVRLIANDMSYASDEGSVEIDFNLENVALTMIMGEILENPKSRPQKIRR